MDVRNKDSAATAVAEATGITKTAATEAINAFTDFIISTLESGEKFSIVGFGSFEPAERNARIGRNPTTGEAINIPAARLPKFKAGLNFKKRVNNKKK